LDSSELVLRYTFYALGDSYDILYIFLFPVVFNYKEHSFIR
jgi:hypothetical protein